MKTTTTNPARPSARTRTTRRMLITVASIVALAQLASGCTLSENSQYRADIQPWGTLYVHLYQVPSFTIILLRDYKCGGNMDCTANYLRASVSVDGPARLVWNYALHNKEELDQAISVSKRSYNPYTGSLDCLMIYSVWTTGWGNSTDPQWCRRG